MERIYKLLNSNKIDAEIGVNLLIQHPIEKIVAFFTKYSINSGPGYTDIESKFRPVTAFYIELKENYVILLGNREVRLRKRGSYGYSEEAKHILKQNYLNGNY